MTSKTPRSIKSRRAVFQTFFFGGGPYAVGVFARIFRSMAAILAAGLFAGCGGPPPQPPSLRVALISKSRNDPYFTACEQGAREAARALGVQLYCESPLEKDLLAQVELVDDLVNRGMDIIAIAPRDTMGIAPALKRARQNGVKIITFDSDADEKRSERAWFVRPASDEAVAQALIEIMARLAGPKARTAFVAAAAPASGENVWIRQMRNYIAAKHPLMQIADFKRVTEEAQAAYHATQELLRNDPAVTGVFAMTPAAFAEVAEAVQHLGLKGQVKVTGLCLPDRAREFVKAGVVQAFVMWNPADLGYLTVHVAHQVATGKLEPGATGITAGRLGIRRIQGREILLGEPLEFNAGNVDQFKF
jgi:ABC-type sugar transport system substrate-binding protein